MSSHDDQSSSPLFPCPSCGELNEIANRDDRGLVCSHCGLAIAWQEEMPQASPAAADSPAIAELKPPASPAERLLPPRFRRDLPRIEVPPPVVLEDGTVFAVVVREAATKSIAAGGTTQEVRHVPLEERIRRRRVRRIVWYVAGTLLLLAVAAWLTRP